MYGYEGMTARVIEGGEIFLGATITAVVPATEQRSHGHSAETIQGFFFSSVLSLTDLI